MPSFATLGPASVRRWIWLPAAPANLSFHRELQGGKPTIVASWAQPAAGQPVPTGSMVTGSGCRTLQSSNAAGALHWRARIHLYVHGHRDLAQQHRQLAADDASARV